MKYFNPILIFALFFSALAFGQGQVVDIKVNYVLDDAKDKTIISYVPGGRLTWSDFQGIPGDTISTSAITSSGIGYHFNLHQTEDSAWFNFTVNCTFSKTKSWGLESKKNEYVLNHEQRHFDISYINALRFIKKLRETSLDVKTYRTEIKRIYREVSAELSAMQNEYDTQTKNGISQEMQEEWNRKIVTQLNDLQKSVAKQ